MNFDLDVLRSFVLGMELGSFARAADRLGRSTSAVSAQLKKLEEQAGTPVLRKAGRGMALTEAGESLLAYARRLLELNDEAVDALRGIELAGWVRLGMPEDFGERLLPEVLGRFARAHPRVKIEARIARNVDLLDQLNAGRLDLALAWDSGVTAPHTEPVGRLAMQWIVPAGGWDALSWQAGEPLPLVMFEAPCLMRSAATAALDKAGIPWRLAFSSPSLGGIWAAVAAGLGVTVRTGIGLPERLQALPAGESSLPPLPDIRLGLLRSEAEPGLATKRLGEIILESLAGMPALQRNP
ncbi:LysR substrate-binding domain-containing protein [Chitinimonas naiadis]